MNDKDFLPIRGRINISDLNSGKYRPDQDTLDAIEDAIERLVWTRFNLSCEVFFDTQDTTL